MNQFAFVLKRFLDLTNWKASPIFDMPMDRDLWQCPVDGERLGLLASLISQSTEEQVRIGCCPSCGLVTYIDRPTPAAIGNYYRQTWMGENSEQALAVAEQYAAKTDAVGYSGFGIDLSRPLLEIGVGCGAGLPSLRASGFTDIRGVEACPARAAAVRTAFGIDVQTGDFTQLEFADKFGVLVCHQVLEHVPDPDTFIAKCASIQDAGGLLILSVPELFIEPAMAALLFWPHLHTFGERSLLALLHRHGYEAVEVRRGISVIARKVDSPAMRETKIPSLNAVASGLAQGMGCPAGDLVLTWQRDFDGATWEAAQHAFARAKIPEFPRKLLMHLTTDTITDAPLEIQFPGRVEMCWK